MSRDIRSFFMPKKPQKPKEEDDDVIPNSPDVQINKKKEKRNPKKRVINDSDDESNNKKKPVTPKKSPANKNTKSDLKEVNIVDLFGKAPIKRTEPLVKKVKKETEVGIHSDDDFEQSLLEIDSIKEIKTEPNVLERNKLDSSPDQKPSTSNTKPNNNHSKSPTKTVSKTEITAKQKYASKKEESKLNSKRKFSEFTNSEGDSQEEKVKRKKINKSICDDNENITVRQSSEEYHEADVSAMDDETPSKNPTKKHNMSLNDSVLTDEERHERKIHSAALYKKYLNRSGPKHLGQKEIPEGPPDCLKNCAFLLTGVLDSFERDEIVDAITKYGGCVKSGISKKVTHVLAGDDAGPAKMSKAQELGIKIINEDQFLQMITNPENSNAVKTEPKDDNSKKKKSPKDKKMNTSTNGIKSESSDKNKEKAIKEDKSNEKKKHSPNHDKSMDNIKKESKSDTKDIKKEIYSSKTDVKREKSNLEVKTETDKRTDLKKEHENLEHIMNASMWVEKYKPQNVKQIIGQHGDASNVRKLINWLTKWYVNRKAKLPKPSPWAKNDDGGYYKAVLLSGPPGVGKTTTVSLVCKELGFDMVEYNASDTRNKTLIKVQIGDMLTTTSLSAYAKGDTGKQAVTKKHVLVMDEVDGMAGNEDRGGLQELINLIKMTSVPIICMCNDRNSQKMRSLVNYCYDLRFNRPRVDQIKSAMMSICFKEGLKLAPDVLTQLIVAANQDVRQTLNLLSMWAVDPSLTDTERLRKDASTVKKDIKLGPWEAVRKVFAADEHKSMSIHDKSDLFFYDYSLAPLFVQENYLQVAPHCPKHEVLQRLSRAADSISLGDLVDKRIRSAQAWSLLPTQAMYSSVIPGYEMAGHVAGQIQFPGWLGKNSRAGKMHRLCQEIHAHTRLSTSGSKSSIFLDYSMHLRDAIINPLIKDKADGIPKSLEVLESYHLLREDLESLVELSVWPGQRNPTILVDSKVKAAMTRTYNKTASALPYAPGAIKKGTARDDHEEGLDEEEHHSDEPEDSDPENDALIKKKKTKETEKPSTSKGKASKEKASSSKGKKK